MHVTRLPSGNYRIQVQVDKKRVSYTASTPEECEIWYNARKNNQTKSSKEYAVITKQIIEQQNAKQKKQNNPDSIITKSEFKKLKLPNDVKKELEKIDEMNGEDFEKYIISLLHLSGYFYGAAISSTKQTGDFGADIIVECINGERICIQCKRLKSNVGIDAVQEVYASQHHYHAEGCAVITNSHFTKSAIDLAHDNGVTLIDRNGLCRLIEIEIEHLNTITKKSQWSIFLNGIAGQKTTDIS